MRIMSLSQLDVGNSNIIEERLLIDPFSAAYLPKIYEALGRLRIPTGSFRQLTRTYMNEDFNPKTPDREGVR